MKAFEEGEDFHTKTASLMFGVLSQNVTDYQRRIGKVCNFALIYGGFANTLLDALKPELPDITLAKSREYHQLYLASYPTMFKRADEIRDKAERDGFVETIFDRRIPLFEMSSEDKKTRDHGRRLAYNAKVSGSAADILKISMVKIHQKYQKLNWLDRAKMIMTIHDELIFQVDKTLDLREYIGETCSILRFKQEGFSTITASVAVGERWGVFTPQGRGESVPEFLDRFLGNKGQVKEEPGKEFILELPNGVTRSGSQLEKFRIFLEKNPGNNIVSLKIGEDVRILPWKTSLDLKAKDKIGLMMGGVFFEKLTESGLQEVFG
jgi:hypothetical protein